MISIVTGTLNRLELLKLVVNNTVEKSELVELVLVDGGSTDGTIDYIKSLNHSRIKLIEVGERSFYPHYMNLGIKNATYDLIVQWNDDVLLCNEWDEIIKDLDDSMMYIFSWKGGNLSDFESSKNEYTFGHTFDNGINGMCLNYGIYNKKVFREIGMYNDKYKYYWCDADMASRTSLFNYKKKFLQNIKVLSINSSKRAEHFSDDEFIFRDMMGLYVNKKLPKNIEFLK